LFIIFLEKQLKIRPVAGTTSSPQNIFHIYHQINGEIKLKRRAYTQPLE